ncbi:Ig-like domain-containing protein [Candidatus Entotheonella palauensis]|nr:Ig-like domain-containing protein [Candidatus Entotheonella palauensis]
MKPHAALMLLSVLILASLMACAPKQAELPVRTQSGHLVSIKTTPQVVWLKGPVSTQPNNELGLGGLIVQVRDDQGQPVEGVPVTFAVEPSWSDNVSLSSDRVTAKDGRARAIIEPEFAGNIQVHVNVEDVMQTATFQVKIQDVGNTTASPTLIGLMLPL